MMLLCLFRFTPPDTSLSSWGYGELLDCGASHWRRACAVGRHLSGSTGGVGTHYIGAHAAVSGFALLTRDVSRYRSYFPTMRLFAPPC